MYIRISSHNAWNSHHSAVFPYQERYIVHNKSSAWVPSFECNDIEDLNYLQASEGCYPSKANVLTAFGLRKIWKLILLCKSFVLETTVICNEMRKGRWYAQSRQYLPDQNEQISHRYAHLHHTYTRLSNHSYEKLSTNINRFSALAFCYLPNNGCIIPAVCIHCSLPLPTTSTTFWDENRL